MDVSSIVIHCVKNGSYTFLDIIQMLRSGTCPMTKFARGVNMASGRSWSINGHLLATSKLNLLVLIVPRRSVRRPFEQPSVLSQRRFARFCVMRVRCAMCDRVTYGVRSPPQASCVDIVDSSEREKGSSEVFGACRTIPEKLCV